MFIRLLRQRKCLSQEQLAELSGLSLRTIQRAEGGHRVGYASMRALAAAFDIDVDTLELEMYAVNGNARNYRELPLWIRLIFGRGWFSNSRRELLITEFILLSLSGLLCFQWVAGLQLPIMHDSNGIFPVGAVFLCFAAYLTAVCIRIGDRYAVWRLLGHSQPRRFFGLVEKES